MRALEWICNRSPVPVYGNAHRTMHELRTLVLVYLHMLPYINALWIFSGIFQFPGVFFIQGVLISIQLCPSSFDPRSH